MKGKVLITGGAGYIGSKLVTRFLDEGFEVKALEFNEELIDNLRDHIDSDGFEYQLGDVTREEDVEEACEDVTHVIHLAGIASVKACRDHPKQAIEVNGYSVRRILEQVKDRDDFRKFVFPSSVAGMYTKPEGETITEKHPVFPIDDYGVSKYLGEQYCRVYDELYGVPTTIFRQSNIYGPSPGMGFNIVPHIFARRALKGQPLTIHGSGEQSRDFLYIDDLVEAYYLAAVTDEAKGEVYNVCRGEVHTINELAETIAEVTEERTGDAVELKRIPDEGDEVEIRKFNISNEKARRELGFEPEYDLRDGLELLIDHLLGMKGAL